MTTVIPSAAACVLLSLLTCVGCEDSAPTSAVAAEGLLDSLSRPTVAKASEARVPRPVSLAQPATITGIAVHRAVEGEASSVRVVLSLQGEPPFRRSERAVSATAGRAVQLIFEDTQADRSLFGERAVGSGGLDAVRVQRDGDLLRVDFEVAADARYRLFSMPDPFRLVLDVERPRLSPRGPEKLLVLDPGHGGEDLGSPGPHGLWEGKLTLELSRRVKAWLARIAPHIRVRLTRDSNVYLSLEERAAMANSLGADLFVSVHLNAATTLVDKGGVAAFVLDINNDRNVLRLAARENGTSTSDVSPMQFLVGSIARTEQQRASMAAATLIQRGTLFSGRRMLPTLADRGVKSAMFYVLVGAQMPAVLVEASFITQPDEAKALTVPAYRDVLAEGIARGIAKVLTGP